MKDINRDKQTAIDELSNKLKEVYNLAKHKKMKQIDIIKKYKITVGAIGDLLAMDEEQLDSYELREIVKELENKETRKVGAELAIGNNILGYIRNSVNVNCNKKSSKEEHYEKFYKEAQKVWMGVAKGKRIENISKELNLKIEDAWEILYRYSNLINQLQSAYKKAKIKRAVLDRDKEKYFLDDYTVNYIKSGMKSNIVEETINSYFYEKYGFIPEGGERDEL